jgi:hypothetical protein
MELITMSGAAEAAGAKRGVFEVDEGAALAALEEAWGAGSYHAFGVDHGTWSAVTSAEDALTGATADELDQKIRAYWQEMQ